MMKLSKEELDFVKNNYRTMKQRDIAEELGRSRYSVVKIISKLGLKLTKEEFSIRMKSRDYLGRQSWSEIEENYLVENYKNMTSKSLALNLNRRRATVLAKLSHLGLLVGEEIARSRSRLGKRHWTKEKDIFLKANFGTMSTEELALQIGICGHSILKRAHSFGLELSPEEKTKRLLDPTLSIELRRHIDMKDASKTGRVEDYYMSGRSGKTRILIQSTLVLEVAMNLGYKIYEKMDTFKFKGHSKEFIYKCAYSKWLSLIANYALYYSKK